MTLRLDGSYVTIRGGPLGIVARTVQIRTDLHVDLTAEGHVVGVERVGGMVTVEDLGAVLFSVPFDTEEDTA